MKVLRYVLFVVETDRKGMLYCLHLHLRSVWVVPKSCSLAQETPAGPSPPCSLESWGRCGCQHWPGTLASRGLQSTSLLLLPGVWPHQPWRAAPVWVWGLWWRPGGHGSCSRRISLTCGTDHRAVFPSRAEFYNRIYHSSELIPVMSAAPWYHLFSSQKTGSSSPTPALNWSISGLCRVNI